MARKTRMTVCALNIIIHDAEKRDYAKLLVESAKLQEVVSFNKTHAGTLLGVKKKNVYEKDYLFGTLCRFVNINPPYFDSIRQSIITDEDGNPIDLVESHIKANAELISFCLFEEEHYLFVVSNKMSPSMAKKFFENLFQHESIIQQFGSVDVMLQTTKEAIDAIFAMFSIRNLHITVNRPNPHNLNQYSLDVEKFLDDQRAEKLNFIMASRNKDGIAPKGLTKDFIESAKNNGRVQAKGLDLEGKSVTLDTDNSPLTDTDYYDKAIEDANIVLVNIAKKIWGIISK